MVEPTADREDLLRREFHAQTARIRWHDLQTHYAHGSVVQVNADLDLVEVAVRLGLDDTVEFEAWIRSGQVSTVSAEQALSWFEANQELWAVVAAPWVLVQERGQTPSSAPAL